MAMMRRCTWAGGLVLGFGLVLLAQPAAAVAPAEFSMKGALGNKHIFVVKVDKLYPDKPAMMLKVEETLKGKAPFEKLAVNLNPIDEKSQKDKAEQKLLKRLDEGLPLVVYANKRGMAWTAFCYTNGTWFQIHAMEEGTPAKLGAWSFVQLEPVLRQTYKGTTAEMRQVIIDGLAGKKEPPDRDKDEQPGIGPELKKEEKKSSRGTSSGGPLFGVIPTVAIGGPLAILSMLFPTLFGKPKEIMQRYLALLTTITITSTVYLLHVWLYPSLRGHAWASPLVLWSFMAIATLLGAVWAWRRHRAAVRNGVAADALLPKRGEEIVFILLSLSGLVLASYAFGRGELLDSPWKEFLLMWAVVWAGTLTGLYLRNAQTRNPNSKPRLSMEGMMLAALAVTCAAMGTTFLPRSTAGVQDPIAQALSDDVPPARDLKREFGGVQWAFQPDEPGRLDSTPLVAGDRVYVAVAHRAGFSAYGRIYCLDSGTGEKQWTFDDEENMKHIYCAPQLADGRLYIGEGYHQDDNCKVYCIDAATGKKLWDFKTKSHTESRPFVAEGKVFFGAGDDGLYCLDAVTGQPLWHFEGLHIDTNVSVIGNRLYGGSGYGTKYWMFCLDTANGNSLWRTESAYPVFGSPTVFGKRVYYGTGNGDMLNSDKKPAGALLCLDIDNGKLLWRFAEVTDGIHTRPAVDREHVYFGSRDKHVYCVGRTDGKLRWKINTGSPVVAAPALGYCSCCGDTSALYVVASGGRVLCLDPDNGVPLWSPFDLGAHSSKPAQLIATPRLWASNDSKEEQHRLFVAASVGPKDDTMPILYCLSDKYAWPSQGGR
jgi:outer membrane protein assembly factor BamB